MKTLRFITLTFLLAIAKLSFSQTGLFVVDSTLFFSVDTAYQGTNITYGLQLQNGSPSTTYTGNITIQIYNDSTGTGGFGTIVPVDSTYIQGATINANNSLFVSDSIFIDPSIFRSGINTVVIWPVAAESSGFTTLDTTRQNILVLAPLASRKQISLDKITLFPNPFNSIIWLKGLDKNIIEQVRIFNVLGEEIMQLQIKESSTLNLNQLEKGVYFIRIEATDGKQIIIKTIKE